MNELFQQFLMMKNPELVLCLVPLIVVALTAFVYDFIRSRMR